MKKHTEEKTWQLKTTSAEETVQLGARVARLLKSGDVLALIGPLGAGKTTFVKGLAEGLNPRAPIEVASPTFVLMHEYPGERTLYHMDAYRLSGAREAEEAGLEEFLYKSGVAVVEWADRISALLPAHALTFTFSISGNERTIELSASPERLAELRAGGLA